MPTSASTPITWRLHLHAPPAQVYALLATDLGRARFWAERTEEREGAVHFIFPNGYEWAGRILAADPPRRFVIDYIGHSTAAFELAGDGAGGTDLTLTDSGVPPEDHAEVTAGWVSVLLALKAAADFGVDLRGHDPARTWDQGYADN